MSTETTADTAAGTQPTEQTIDQREPRRRGKRTDESIKQLNDGRWRARPSLGADPVTGKQVRPTKTFATKGEAQKWVREQHRQWNTATWAPRSERTFDEAADHWLKVRQADGISPNTLRADRDDLARARRVFGAVPVQKLTAGALVDWAATMSGKTGQPLAPGTRRRAIVTLKGVMAHAVRMRWLSFDPSADLESPEQKEITAAAAEDIWTSQQMTAFLDHVAGHRLGGCFALTMLGLRREEVGGLRWCDIDVDAGALRIRQARIDVNGKDIITTPKTKRSVRELPLPPRELAMLKAMKLVHKTERLAVGWPLADGDLVLSREDGTWLPVREYSRLFTAQRAGAGLKAITLAGVSTLRR
jgi:integrase